MLQLKDITKDYQVAGEAVHALKGVSLNFRKNEFVSILGASGCGKTTLLNIIGGLDKYTSGDLIINGVSTKKFNDRDWDTYRNHSIGFIFQSYHLIPHQTILQNVELALTISGVSKEERRRRAEEALDKVGLKDKIHNRPNQLSGGQAQRVAIARALINDPEIVLADEPTGALDSKTSIQIMDLLKEISKDRLVIMVTHNPELAEQYSTRIIRLLDGLVTDDSMPYDGNEKTESVQLAEEESKTNKGRKKKSSMSIGMAFMLSLKNLLSKTKRTVMVSVAGSIGIIGVSMVLAISAGVQGFIRNMQDDMLSGYPLTVSETALDFDSLMNMTNSHTELDITKLQDGKIYVDSVLETLMGMQGAIATNYITEDYINYVRAMPTEYYNAIQFNYGYNISNNIYTDFKISNNPIDDPSKDTSGNYSLTAIRQKYTSILGLEEDYKQYTSLIATADSFEELPDNYSYILSQYDIVATSGGKTEKLTESELKDLFENKESLILVLNRDQVTDLTLGQYGYFSQEEFLNFAYRALVENDIDDNGYYNESLIDKYIVKDGNYEGKGLDYSYFIGEDSKTFKWYPNDTVYSEAGDEEFLYHGMHMPAVYKYNHDSKDFSDDGAVELKVKVILQKKDNISYGCLNSGLYYTNELAKLMLSTSLESKIVDYVKEHGQLNCLPYNYSYTYISSHEGNNYHYDSATDLGFIIDMGRGNMMSMMMGGGSSSSDDPLEKLKVEAGLLGGSDIPVAFSIYPLDFDGKDLITDYLDKWNDACESDTGTFEYVNADGVTVKVENLAAKDAVKYTDTVGLMIMMINTMIDMITIALVAFTALSLVVSTVMVGIITYVSVVERIKEIGILRSVGARKKDIKRLFNAETFIIGFAAGFVGIVITYVLSLIINIIVGTLTGIFTIAALPWWQALIMVCISVVLTLISGLIPASSAAKKDPVVALRTE